MCRSRHFISVVIGRAIVVCLLSAIPIVALAWGSVPVTDNSDGAPQTPADARMVDPAVQQAAWNKAQRPNSRAMAPNTATHGTQSAPVAPQKRKGPLFGGQPMRLPSLPFGRAASADKAETSVNNLAVGQPIPGNQNRMQQRAAVRPPAPMNRTNQRMGVNPAVAGNQNNHSARVASAAPMQRTRQDMPPQPMPTPDQLAPSQRLPKPTTPSAAAARQISAPNQGAMQNQRAVQSAPNVGMANAIPNVPVPFIRSATPSIAIPAVTTTPNEFAPPTAMALPVAVASNSPADKLVMKAHELTLMAKTEADFSKIIETCRRARVSQASPAATRYANDLAAWAYNRRGQMKAEAGHDSEAMLDFDDAVRADPKRWRALHNRGVLFAQAGEFEKAFDDFNRTIELSPNFAKAYCNRAALFMVADNLPAAAKDYARAVELDPNLEVAHRGRARACHLLGQLQEAADHYDAAVQLAPNDDYAISSRADLLTDMGRYTDAAAGYDEAIRLQPNSSQIYSSSAWLLATCPDTSVRNPELAIERAKTAIELCGKEDAAGLDTLAAAQASAGEFDAAAQLVSKALALAPADERRAYQERLELYQHGKAYRIERVQQAAQANYQESN